jgi:hypothetical protein
VIRQPAVELGRSAVIDERLAHCARPEAARNADLAG